MRKMLLSLVCTLLTTGLVLSTEYTIVSYNKEKRIISLKDKDGNAVEGHLTDKTKITRVKSDGTKADGDLSRVEKMLGGENVSGKKLEARIDKGNITEITTKGGNKKTAQ